MTTDREVCAHGGLRRKCDACALVYDMPDGTLGTAHQAAEAWRERCEQQSVSLAWEIGRLAGERDEARMEREEARARADRLAREVATWRETAATAGAQLAAARLEVAALRERAVPEGWRVDLERRPDGTCFWLRVSERVDRERGWAWAADRIVTGRTALSETWMMASGIAHGTAPTLRAACEAADAAKRTTTPADEPERSTT